jgi:hypothetical protein
MKQEIYSNKQIELHTSKYQKVDTPTFVKYEQDNFNSYQNYLYKRALYGLKGLPQEELEKMCSAKKKRVNNVFFRAQKLLNVYKHKLTKKYCDSFLLSLFPNSNLAKVLASVNDFEEEHLNTLSFKQLGIEKNDIANLFVEEGVLPKNFFELTIQDDPKFLPKFKTN